MACRGAIDYRDVCHIRHGVENFCDHDPCLIYNTFAGLKINLQAVFLREVFNPHYKRFDIVVRMCQEMTAAKVEPFELRQTIAKLALYFSERPIKRCIALLA